MMNPPVQSESIFNWIGLSRVMKVVVLLTFMYIDATKCASMGALMYGAISASRLELLDDEKL